jgi:D-serine deaminase-like pyridoxal phosphate-dependent protein
MSSLPSARLGIPLEEIDTPALIVDLDALEGNIARMAQAMEKSPARLRPHAKSHKCAEIAKRQIAAGAVGVCAQKVSEAEALVAGGVADVLVTNEIVGAQKVARLARLAREAKVAVLADDARNVAELDAAARAGRTRVDVLVEIDVGAHRCGIEPGAPAAALAKRVADCKNLRFAGLHAYHGAAQHLRSASGRRDAIAAAAEHALLTKTMIEKSGIGCETVSGAGTGTFLLEGASRVFNEIQPGSYVFMDADYNRNEWERDWPRFEQSLFVLATVMSVPAADRAVVDAGLKASSVDSGMPQVYERPGVEYAKASDEHGVLRITNGVKAPALGEKLLLVPGHCDPTVNLYDWLVGLRKGKVEALWPITARGAVV